MQYLRGWLLFCRREFSCIVFARFIEGQASLRSHDSAPRPPSSPLFHQQVVPLCQSSCVSPAELTDGRKGREGVGKEPNHTTALKAWPSVNHSILSDCC
jgi:hypothetical protein